MRNLKKIFAVLVVVALMASMMVPALAAGFTYEAEATKLNNVKLMEGMNLGDKVTRIQALTFAIKAAGKNAEAQALTDAEVAEILANVVDADKVPNWGKKYLAWAVKNGKTSGVDASIAPKVKFVADGTVDAKVFLFWTLSIGMGYQGIGTATATSKAVDAKVISVTQAVDFNLKGELIRDDVAGILYGAAMTGVNADGKGFMASLITAGFVSQQVASDNGFASAPAPVALAVVSVTANSLREILVTFNKPVDKDSAQAIANYKLNGVALTTNDSATLQDGATTVILNLASTATMTNQTEYKLKVKDVKDAATGTKLSEVETKFTPFDSSIPAVVSIEVTGPRSIKVNFSEPINNQGTFIIDDGRYYASPSVSTNRKTVELTIGVDFSEGVHNVKVKDATDYYGFKVAETTSSFTVTKDASAPVVSIDKVTETQITLKFTKPVTDTNLNTDVTAYYGYNDTTGFKGTLARKTPGDLYNDTYYVNFTTPIPQGTQTLYLNTKADKLQDKWGNDVASTTLSFNVVVDNDAPVVKSVVADKDNKIIVTFNEDINANDAVKAAYYTLKTANGSVMKTADNADLDSNGHFLANVEFKYDKDADTVTMELDHSLTGGTYNLTIEKIRDASYKANVITTVTVPFDVSDSSGPSVSSAMVNSDGSKIRVKFSESMATTGLTDTASYRLIVDNGSSKALPDNSTVSIVDSKTVEIALGTADANINGTNDKVQVSGSLKDSSGNAIGGFFSEKVITADAIAIGSVKTDDDGFNVYVKAANQIDVKINQELKAIDANDITVTATAADGTAAAIASAYYTNDSGSATVTVLLNKDLHTDARGFTSVVFGAGAVTNVFGTDNTAFTLNNGVNVKDQVAPKITATETKTTTRIDLTFSEAINTSTVSIYTFGVAGTSVKAIAWVDGGDPLNVADDVLQLTLNDAIATGAKPAVTQVYDLKDLKGNVLAAGTGVKETADVTTPTATVTMASSNATDTRYAKVGDVITITVATSEDYDAPVVTVLGKAAAQSPVTQVDPTTFTAAYTVDAGDADGAITFTVDFKDKANNAAAQITAVTSGVAVTVDKTAPSAITTVPAANIAAAGTLVLTATNGPLTDASWTAILNQIKANTAVGGNWITGVAASDLTMVIAANGTQATITNNAAGAATLAADFVITAANVVDRAGNVAAGNITIDVTP